MARSSGSRTSCASCARCGTRSGAGEIYVCGAHRWRNPDEDLPADFEHNRDVHYAAIRRPRDPQAFIADLQARLYAGLERLNHATATNTAGGVTTRRGRPWIVVPAIGQLPAAPNIQALHTEIQRRHGMLDLLEVLKDADHLSDFTAQLTSVASREITDPVTARRRKLLVAFGIGSNIAIKRIAEATDGHPADTEAALRRFRRLYFHPRRAAARDHRARQQDARRARRDALGRRDNLHLRLKAVRLLGLQPDDRVAQPLRRRGRDGLLARREKATVHPQPADDLLGLRGRRDAPRDCSTTTPTPRSTRTSPTPTAPRSSASDSASCSASS